MIRITHETLPASNSFCTEKNMKASAPGKRYTGVSIHGVSPLSSAGDVVQSMRSMDGKE
jgi:hypothetical protein